jgi:hypothetical protein
LTVNVRPAIVAVPLRGAPGFGSMASCTTPLPAPLTADVILIHGTSADAVHAQPAAALTVTLAEPPAGSIDACSGLIVNAHASD